MTSRYSWALVVSASIVALMIAVPLATGSTKTVASSSPTPGNAAAGRPVFIAFCGKCHAMRAVGSKGTLGTNLDQVKVSYARVITAVREGLGGIQAEYEFANKCSPTSDRCLTWVQLDNVAKFVVTASRGPAEINSSPGSP